MGSPTHLHFRSHIGKQKPESIVNRAASCPFCDRSQLSDIIAEDGCILLVKNKFPVLEETVQTVLIETDECESELSEYTPEHLHRLFRFGFANWLEMDRSGEFTSVLFYKNHGPYSGGTIRHPHMQIVGLRDYEYRHRIQPSDFEGLEIHTEPGLIFNVSTKPRVGFFEFNVLVEDLLHIDALADATQVAAHYTLNHFNKNCNSYNLFFYPLPGKWAVKIVPRFVTSPLYVGFSIPQVSDRIFDVVGEIRQRYYAER